MTKQEILDYFKDIDLMYNHAGMHDDLSKMLDELLEQPEHKFFVNSDGKITPLPIQKHGHWIRSPKFLPETQCSVCKKTYVGDYRTFKFCPDCGAKMDEEVKQYD